nr:CopD family protein [Streptomyces sp. SID685]
MWRRFSLVAMVCVAAVVVSGLWMSWEHVGRISQLWTTGYGVALLVKILLVLGLVMAGAVNQFWLMPRMTRPRRAGETASLFHLTLRHFPKAVWGEVVLGLAVLVVVPFLSGSARTEAGSPPAEPSSTGYWCGGCLTCETKRGCRFWADIKHSGGGRKKFEVPEYSGADLKGFL